MFDMDGTLTDSFAIDENCYVLAIEQALKLERVVTEWDTYLHASSSFCLEEIVRRHRGTAPDPLESRAVQARMVALMDEIQRLRGRGTAEIPGAAACLPALRARGYATAIASGDWEASARHKLTTAGIPFEELPSAFCDVSHARTEIMLAALDRAKRHYGCDAFERIVYVGDAAWDVRACRELDWPLVGIGTGEDAAVLGQLGTSHVLPDYRSLDQFLAAVESATTPRRIAG